jgi:hypothetical protein
MPKDRNLTYSDRQAQAARDKKLSAQKKVAVESPQPNPTPVPAKAKGKR